MCSVMSSGGGNVRIDMEQKLGKVGWQESGRERE